MEAIDYLHKQGLVHRDIKPENILINKKFSPRLADFGTSSQADFVKNTFCGIYEYMAPEIYLREKQNEKVDIWAVGILLFEMTHQFTPFKKESVNGIKAMLTENRIKFRSDLNPQIKALILRILKYSPSERPTSKEILCDPLFSDFRQTISTNVEQPVEAPANAEQKTLPNKNNAISSFINIICFSRQKSDTEERIKIKYAINEEKTGSNNSANFLHKNKSESDIALMINDAAYGSCNKQEAKLVGQTQKQNLRPEPFSSKSPLTDAKRPHAFAVPSKFLKPTNSSSSLLNRNESTVKIFCRNLSSNMLTASPFKDLKADPNNEAPKSAKRNVESGGNLQTRLMSSKNIIAEARVSPFNDFTKNNSGSHSFQSILAKHTKKLATNSENKLKVVTSSSNLENVGNAPAKKTGAVTSAVFDNFRSNEQIVFKAGVSSFVKKGKALC